MIDTDKLLSMCRQASKSDNLKDLNSGFLIVADLLEEEGDPRSDNIKKLLNKHLQHYKDGIICHLKDLNRFHWTVAYHNEKAAKEGNKILTEEQIYKIEEKRIQLGLMENLIGQITRLLTIELRCNTPQKLTHQECLDKVKHLISSGEWKTCTKGESYIPKKHRQGDEVICHRNKKTKFANYKYHWWVLGKYKVPKSIHVTFRQTYNDYYLLFRSDGKIVCRSGMNGLTNITNRSECYQ